MSWDWGLRSWECWGRREGWLIGALYWELIGTLGGNDGWISTLFPNLRVSAFFQNGKFTNERWPLHGQKTNLDWTEGDSTYIYHKDQNIPVIVIAKRLQQYYSPFLCLSLLLTRVPLPYSALSTGSAPFLFQAHKGIRLGSTLCNSNQMESQINQAISGLEVWSRLPCYGNPARAVTFVSPRPTRVH